MGWKRGRTFSQVTKPLLDMPTAHWECLRSSRATTLDRSFPWMQTQEAGGECFYVLVLPLPWETWLQPSSGSWGEK